MREVKILARFMYGLKEDASKNILGKGEVISDVTDV